jgi:DNA-binding winged helix-turn-helix (wHTH) protein/tetratricopeptide (TPR) repeat protein
MVRFGPFQLDSKSRELRRDDRVISLRPKSFQLLTYMTEHPGRLLTKDELLDAGWGKTAVSDGVLKVCIWEIREALGDDPAEPRYVQTVHRAGYRFIEAKPQGTKKGDSGIAFGGPVQYPKSGDVHIIGRDQEMATLRVAIDAALGGETSLVMLVGEPGIGKTRLAEEAGVYARHRGAQVLVGRCYEGEAASPYSPFVEVIREYLSTRPDDALEAELGNKAPDLAKLVPEIRERIPKLPPPPAADPNGERIRLFDSVEAFLVNASKANPIMLHLEDLHWADKASLQLLQHLARRLKGSRLLVVGTYRDVELDRSRPLSGVLAELRHERLYQRVLLRGLSESEVKELIEAILQQQVAGGSGEPFVRAIQHETEGNPFFIEEVLHHLLESGGLYRREGRWVTDPRAVAGMGVPENVREVIGRRLSRLSETAHRVLTAAAFLGREFEFEVLGRMSELEEEMMVPAIEEALSHRLVVETQDRGRPRYAFTHALVRQTLCEELSLPRRQHLHLQAAQAIETVHEHNLEPHVAALANHYRAAGAAADPEKAIDYSIRAGRAAHAVYAYEETGAHWRAALELMDERGGGDQKRRGALLLLLGDQLVSSGAKAVEYLEAAAPLFEELGDNQAACDVHLTLAIYLSANHLGELDMRRAMPHFTKAEALLAEQPESLRHALFYFIRAGACTWTQRIGDGIAAGKRSMEICERLAPSCAASGYDRDSVWCFAAVVTSFLLMESGAVSEGLHLAHQARRQAETINHTLVGSTIAWIGGCSYLLLRDPRKTQDWFTSEFAKPRTAHAAFQRVSPDAPPRNDNVPLIMHDRLVIACTEMGDLSKARDYLAEVDATNKPAELLFFEGEWELAGKRLSADFERSLTSGNREDELWWGLPLARLHRFTGDHAKAVQVLQRALDISVDSGDILYELATRSSLATMAADAGDAREALPHLQRCREILGAGENWLGLAGNVERAEAVVAAAQAEFAVAEDQFKKAIATFQRYCLPWEQADTLQFWGRALLAAGERVGAIDKFDAAIEIYHSHGAGARFVEYVLADKMRAQASISTHAEVQPPLTNWTRAVAAGSAQERPHLVAQSRSNASGSRKVGPG